MSKQASVYKALAIILPNPIEPSTLEALTYISQATFDANIRRAIDMVLCDEADHQNSIQKKLRESV